MNQPAAKLGVLITAGVDLDTMFARNGTILLVLLSAALVAAVAAFHRAAEATVDMRDLTLLNSFMWKGLSLLVFYHALWVVFAVGLVHAWPLKTVAPSGK